MDKNTIKQRVRAKFNGMKFRGTSDMTCSAIDEVIDNLETGGGILDAPSDGKAYVRKDAEWVEDTSVGKVEALIQYEYPSYSYVNLDLTEVDMHQGAIDNSTGEEVANVQQVISSSFTPVEPLSILSLSSTIVDAKFLMIYVFFYHVNSDGTYTAQMQYKFNSKKTQGYSGVLSESYLQTSTIVPPTANAVKFKFILKDGSSTIKLDKEDVPLYASIRLSTSNYLHKIVDKDIILEGNCIDLSTAEWLQMPNRTDAVDNTKQVITTSFIKVTPGHKLIFLKSNCLESRSWMVHGYSSKITGNDYDTLAYLTAEKCDYIVPDNINYIRIVYYSSTADITPAMAKDLDWRILDVSSANLRSAELMWNLSRPSTYPQGVAIQNGFAFCAFADGYIEIYDIASKSKIQEFLVPVSSDMSEEHMHCGNIWFGEKYESSDEFGVLWVNPEHINTSMVGLRITRTENVFTVEKIGEVKLPLIDSSVYCSASNVIVDHKNKKLVNAIYLQNSTGQMTSTSYNDIVLQVYSFTNFETGAFTLEREIEFPRLWAIQTGRLIDNELYLLAGIAYSSAGNRIGAIFKFNIATGACDGAIDLFNGYYKMLGEPEGIEVEGSCFVSIRNEGLYRLTM